MDTTESKICIECKDKKALSSFGPNGTARKCADCKELLAERKRAYMIQWRLDNADHLKAYTKQRYADNAEAIKAEVRQYYADHLEERREYHREYSRRRHLEDHEGMLEKRRIWQDANREHLRAYQIQWNNAHPEQVAQHNRTYYLSRLEECRAKHRDYYDAHAEEAIARVRDWRRNNPQKKKLQDMRRDARQAALPDTMTPEQVEFLFQYWGFACAICGKEEGLFGVTLVMDHWIALASPDCPGTVAHNMVVLCNGPQGCNTSKQDTEASAWLTRRYGPRKAKAILTKVAAYFALVAGDA